jgi:hypothetical protein
VHTGLALPLPGRPGLEVALDHPFRLGGSKTELGWLVDY